MSDDKQIGELLNQIGLLLSEDVRGDPEKALLYVEGDPGVIAASVFLDHDDRIFYRARSEDMAEALIDLWGAADGDKKWGTMIYTIRNGRFDVRFDYPDPAVWANRKDDTDERRLAAVEAHFGDKPIDFSDP